MLFNSIVFPCFFVVVVMVYYRLDQAWQNRWILLASYVFYGWWDWRFCSLLAASTCLDYYMSNRMGFTESPRRRRWILAVTVSFNLGVLAFFKYFNFFASSAQAFLEGVGLHADFFTLNVVLPVGISFYTFQSISYMVDVYRRDQKPEKDFEAYAVYVAFFPQLMAGPIERAGHMLPQYARRREFDWQSVRNGLPLILLGYFKKVVIADSLAPLVEVCFGNPSTTPGIDLLLGVYAFAIQIYCDFSGYTDIARGLARILGVELMRNFATPYFSRSITEFWRRWHISLSSWLRDYLYIPLGGNRIGPVRTYVNLFLTMLLGGLWHGAAWSFVAWGALQGLLLAIHKRMVSGRPPGREPRANGPGWLAGNAVAMLGTFHLVCLSWILFRAPSLGAAADYLFGMATNPGSSLYARPVLLAFAAMVLIDLGQRAVEDHHWLVRMPRVLRYVVAELIIAATLLTFGYHYGQPSPFLYFQF